jgi:hypothetical protein
MYGDVAAPNLYAVAQQNCLQEPAREGRSWGNDLAARPAMTMLKGLTHTGDRVGSRLLPAALTSHAG